MRIRLIALFLSLALAPSAQASVKWVVKGRGFGHGVGMSQYGAYGYAQHGADYRSILGHYYAGTTVGQLAGREVVRVLVDLSRGDVGFSGASSACGRALDPERSYRAHRVGASVRLRNSRGRTLAACGGRLRTGGTGRVAIARAGAYRGALEVVPTSSDGRSLNVVNAVPVDQYVKGVIANEMPSSWPQSALRAQAVAARSYALSVQAGGNGFDLYDDTRSQVYEGISGEMGPTNEAATATAGQVVMHGGEVAQTYFSACSGGYTESVQNIFFGSPIPYLVGVPDPYDHFCPLHTWKLGFTDARINAKLRPYLEGRLKRIVVIKRGASPRIVWARLYGTAGVTTIRGDHLASALGAYDRWMTFHKVVNGKAVGEKPPGPAGGVTG